MKIIGQSTVASGAPYIHLGYISASPSMIVKKADPTLLFAGLAALIVGLATAFSVSLGKTKSGLTSIHLVRRGIFFGGGLALALAGVMSILLAFAHGRRHDRNASATTHFAAGQVIMHIVDCVENGKPVPADMQQLRAGGVQTTDGWFRDMRLSIESDGKETTCNVVSAGPDGQFGTEDDITRSSGPIVLLPATRPAIE